MKEIGRSIYYSFPLQLVLVHLKKNPLQLLLWVLLFAIVSGSFGSAFGLSYLFLDPEYLGRVSFWSFFIIGICLGIFIMGFNLTSYILNSFRFPFLATLKYPLASYCVNNAVIPAIFVLTYIILLAHFQYVNEFTIRIEVFLKILSLLLGLAVTLGLISLYFLKTNQNIFSLIGRKQSSGEKTRMPFQLKKKMNWEAVQQKARITRVENYFNWKLRLRPVRGVEHYDERLLVTVFQQHHYNALIMEVLTLALLVTLGALADFPAFIIPAGASILIFLSILLMLTGAFSYWTRGWQVIATVIVLLVVSLLIRYQVFNYQNKGYGMDHTGDLPEYNAKALTAFHDPARIQKDISYTLEILENWKEKNSGTEKPKMIFINATGGGHRASLWTMHMMQQLDSIYGEKFMDQTMLITGASGGMLAAAYFRELYLEKEKGEPINLNDPEYARRIGSDLLNPISFMIVSNDMFYPWRKFEYNGKKYRKDRGYIFEKTYNVNTGYLLDKPLSYYREPEYNAIVPMMILSPTVIKDERKLFMSPHPVSYLTRPIYDSVDFRKSVVDGIDFGQYFYHQDAYDIRMSSALRMNATYPYVLPAVKLPSRPAVDVMDAGMRDNYGFETTARFIHVYKDWIKENTDGIIIISINSANAAILGKSMEMENIFSKVFNPVGNIYANWTELQNYNQRYMLYYMKDWFDGKADMIEFNYVPSQKERVASMSFHLTTKEKVNIVQAIDLPINQRELERLHQLME